MQLDPEERTRLYTMLHAKAQPIQANPWQCDCGCVILDGCDGFTIYLERFTAPIKYGTYNPAHSCECHEIDSHE